MRIQCKNVGLVGSADIDLKGITVIAGENDTGKSTISKLFFLITKALNRDFLMVHYKRNKKMQMSRDFDEFYFNSRRELKSNKNRKELFVQRDFFETALVDEISKLIDMNIPKEDAEKRIDELFNKALMLENISSKNIERFSRSIKEKYFSEFDFGKESLVMFSKCIMAIFDGEITNKFNNAPLEIHVQEDNVDILQVSMEDNKLTKYAVSDEAYLKETTLIESPAMFNFVNVVDKAVTALDMNNYYLGLPIVPMQTKDLFDKITRQDIIDEEILNNINISISNIIGGEVKYNSDIKKFLFNKEGKDILVTNVASGIKSFGILQMLLKKGILNERSLVILDEPEVNMHPKWQIKYAELLVDLAKTKKVKILLTSHSPYFIEAIQVYSKKKDFDQNTTFYMANKENIVSNISQIDKDAEVIFRQLSEPFSELERVEGEELFDGE